MKLAERIRQSSGWIYVRPDFRGFLEGAGLGSLEQLASRDLGEPITDCRSSWVRLRCIDSTNFYIKTYAYSTIRDRWRGMLRNTFLAPSRARREWQALSWLRAHGFAAPEPLAVLEKRSRGWLHRAVLVTRAWPGHPAHRLLARLGSVDRKALAGVIHRYVSDLHAAGYRDGNMDLRNVLARRTDSGTWEVAKIDSPRFRVTAPGPRRDRAVRRDLARLACSLRAIGLRAQQ